jgi:hypothetical protein
MRRVFLALAVAAFLLLVAGVGTAAANPPASQGLGQWAGSEQDAGSAAGTAQQEASNQSSPVRVLSPGDDGSVSQSNEASSDATAGNLNGTQQTADQAQGGGSGLQAVGQSATNDQDASALGFTHQSGASNENDPVRVLSSGDAGSVSQSNDASSEASAGNANITEQSADQQQAGGRCCGGTGEQVIGQSADSEQDAAALAATVQEKPSNENISVRVLSPGDDGDVSQSNEASSNAEAGNLNATEQTADQTQAAGDSCKCGGGGEQVIGQSAKNDQDAAALAATKQEKPSNSNISVRVLSPGDDGDVTQTNEASSNAHAGNLNATKQEAGQLQAGGSGLQAIGQSAKNDQDAFALGLTVQKGASNENTPVRVLSPGDSGSVSQSNVASSDAKAGNLNLTEQSADQSQGGSSCKCGSGLQAIGQSADSEQEAAAISATIQEKPSNTNDPVRVLSWGEDGDVSQSNEATSNATAANANATKQAADQLQAGGSGIQAIGQSASNSQGALALGLTIQKGASNESRPIRVKSPGDGGSVSQSNVATSDAWAGNINWTNQHAGQIQGSRDSLGGHCCGTGIQAIGQSSKNHQGAVALAATFQLGLEPPCTCKDHTGVGNRNAPTRVLSPGDDGGVRQANLASSQAKAINLNVTKQAGAQAQQSSCLCVNPTRIQAIGQRADSSQFALGLAATLQLDPSNSWTPDRKKSPGRFGPYEHTGKKAADDTSGSSTVTDQAKQQIERR